VTDLRQVAYRLLIADIYETAGLSRRVSERDAAGLGTTVARWHVLSVLSEEPATLPYVADRLGQARQSVQRVANDLVDDGSLRRLPNPAHARSPLYEITASGTRLLERLWRASDRSRAEMLSAAGLTRDDLADARERLAPLRDALRKADQPSRDHI
jgi:DNA-binding MarR family transcriptional regulator